MDWSVAAGHGHHQRLRNRVHINTVTDLEHQSYKHVVANGALDILEEFRVVAETWIVCPLVSRRFGPAGNRERKRVTDSANEV